MNAVVKNNKKKFDLEAFRRSYSQGAPKTSEGGENGSPRTPKAVGNLSRVVDLNDSSSQREGGAEFVSPVNSNVSKKARTPRTAKKSKAVSKKAQAAPQQAIPDLVPQKSEKTVPVEAPVIVRRGRGRPRKNPVVNSPTPSAVKPIKGIRSAPEHSKDPMKLPIVLELQEKLEAVEGALAEKNSLLKDFDILQIEVAELRKEISARKKENKELVEQNSKMQDEVKKKNQAIADMEQMMRLNSISGASGAKDTRQKKPEVIPVGRGRRAVTVVHGATINKKKGRLTLKGVIDKDNEVEGQVNQQADVSEISAKGLPPQAQKVIDIIASSLRGIDPTKSAGEACVNAVRMLEKAKGAIDSLSMSLMGQAAKM